MSRKPMHPVTRRLYQAVQIVADSDVLPSQSRVAHEANVSAQTLNNWEERGPSAQGLLEFQQEHGINATWILTGHGPPMIDTQQHRHRRQRHRAAEPDASYDSAPPPWPLSAELLTALAALEPAAQRRIENSIRAHLDLPALPAVVGNRAAA